MFHGKFNKSFLFLKICVYLWKNGLSFLSINSIFCRIAPDFFSLPWLSREKSGPWIAHRESFENEQYSLMTAWDIEWNAISRHLDLSCCLDDSMISNFCCLMSLVAMWLTPLCTYGEYIKCVLKKSNSNKSYIKHGVWFEYWNILCTFFIYIYLCSLWLYILEPFNVSSLLSLAIRG